MSTDYWSLSRSADRVLIGTVTRAGKDITLLENLEFLDHQDYSKKALGFKTIQPDSNCNKLSHPSFKCDPLTLGDRVLVFTKNHPTEIRKALHYEKGDPFIHEKKIINEFFTLKSIPEESAKVRFLVERTLSNEKKYHQNFKMSVHPTNFLKELITYHNKSNYFLELSKLNNLPKTYTTYGKTNLNLTYATFIELLEKNSNPKTKKLLFSLLKEKNADLVSRTIYHLGRKNIDSKDISKKIESLLNHPSEKVRKNAVHTLSNRRYYKAFPKIFTLLDDTDPLVRITALSWPWRIFHTYDKESDPLQKKMPINKIKSMIMTDPDPKVQKSACEALYDLRNKNALWPLVWKVVDFRCSI